MKEPGIDGLARLLAASGTRRLALGVFGAAVSGLLGREGAQAKSAFPKDCRRFVVSAGSGRDDKFQHIDDDLRIELIPKGKKGGAKVLLDDDNRAPNGNDGAHLKIPPFTARVGDRIHIVATNAVAGGCELDEIWLHCIEGKGGKVKLTDRITPEECAANADKVGVFFDRTVRIKKR
jgi:hypothetical protein